MTGGIFVDGANLFSSFAYKPEIGKNPRLDFNAIAQVVTTEVSRITGMKTTFPHKTMYRGTHPGMEKDTFGKYLAHIGWKLDERHCTLRDELWVEKGVDVALALDALLLAVRKTINVVVLVSHDADFVPLFERLPRDVSGFVIGWKDRTAITLRTSARFIPLEDLWDRIARKGGNS